MYNGNSRKTRKREDRGYKIFEVKLAKHFPELITDIKPQIKEALSTPSRINTKNPHISILNSNCRTLKTKS